MNASKHLRRLYALALVVFGMIANAGATSANTDVSDIWWNPNESGWGMQMVNTGTFVFATIYVYGPNGSPTWYTGQLNNTAAAQATYTGPLYVTTGPYFGSGSFNPNAVTGRQVGTMTFVLSSVTTGQLNYSVDGVVVNKSVQRQPLTLDNYSGYYNSIVTITSSGCSSPADNGPFTFPLNILITQNGQSITLVLSGEPGEGSCSIVGTYSQLGRMGQVSGNGFCPGDATSRPITLFEMTNTTRTFTARTLSSPTLADSCTEVGEIVGVIPR